MSKKVVPYTTEQLDERNEDIFWTDFYPKLKRYCHFLAQNKWDGDDIAQETFVKALKYSGNKMMSPALLNKIAYHHWIDVVRKRKKITTEMESEQISDDRKENRSGVVELLIENFSPKQAVILLLKEGFLYQIKEIADILGTTEMAVKASLHRTKKRVEKGIDEKKSLALLWDEEEREQLELLFKESLESQDPSILIEALPSLHCITEQPKLQTISRQTPSSTLCMAA
ncbi:sigma-70 family RNA polymerase sigma factor [Neobacillus sp. K501]